MLTGRPAYSHSSLSAAAAPPPPPDQSTDERPIPPPVEADVRRGQAVERRWRAGEREVRFPDGPSGVTALSEAPGESGTGTLPKRWLPVDPELTQPGNRPSLVPTPEDLPDPEPPPVRRHRRRPAAVLALVQLDE